MDRILEDFKSENFSKREIIVYGVLAPLAAFAVCIASELILG